MPLVVVVIVVVGVNRHLWWICGTYRLTKECEIGGVISHLLRMAFTANMLVEADYCIGSGHHQVQVGCVRRRLCERADQQVTALLLLNAAQEQSLNLPESSIRR